MKENLKTQNAQAIVESTEEKIIRLKTELSEGQAKLREKFDMAKCTELDAVEAEIKNLQRCVKREKEMKEEYRKRFSKSFSTPDDFERLWTTRLRDEAIIENANQGFDIGKAMEHPLYKSF